MDERVAQVFRSAACGGGGVVEFVRESGGEFSQSHQLVALLIFLRRVADAVAHYADETFDEYGHLRREFGKEFGGKKQGARRARGARVCRKLGHARERQLACDFAFGVARLRDVDRRIGDVFFAARFDFAFEIDRHPLGGRAFGENGIACLVTFFFGAFGKPTELIFGQTGEDMHAVESREPFVDREVAVSFRDRRNVRRRSRHVQSLRIRFCDCRIVCC